MEAYSPIWIEGYATPLSLQATEKLELHVSTSEAKFDIEIARLGAERRVVHKQEGIAGGSYPVPNDAATHGCRWPVAVSIPVPLEWEGGYYEVVFRVSDGGGQYLYRGQRTVESSAFFVLRRAADERPAGILLELSTNTYNAYNNWSGRCLYAYNAEDKVQGRRVSFERPPASLFGIWELPFVQWAEKAGYAFDYCTNQDLEYHPELLEGECSLVLSVGHDEYWSWGMRDNLEAYIRRGGNVAFFSGNTCCWQVRPEDGGRALVSYKQAYKDDPLYNKGHDGLISSLWSHYLVGRPENQLTGVGFLCGGYHLSHEQYMDGPGAYTVHRPEHWIFEGTGLKRGDAFGGKDTIVGYECDGCQFTLDADGLPKPTHGDGTPETFSILASAPAKWHPDDCEWYERWEKGRVGAATLGVYTRGGTVFTAGSTDWAHGLKGNDPHVMRITKNIIDKLSA